MGFLGSLVDFVLSLVGWHRGFMFASDFFAMLSEEWVLYISGRKGSGKTLLAFAIADYLLQMPEGAPKGIWTNIPSSLPFHLDVRDCVFVLDEGAEFVDARDSKRLS